MNRARPEDWYRIRRLGDDVTLIDEPWIHQYYRCNIWHVRGRDRDMLVDTGMGVVSLRSQVPLVTERPLTAAGILRCLDYRVGAFRRMVHKQPVPHGKTGDDPPNRAP